MAENSTDRTMQLVDAFLDKYEQGEMKTLQTVCSADYISDYLSQKDEVPLSGTDKEVKSRMETLLDAFLNADVDLQKSVSNALKDSDSYA